MILTIATANRNSAETLVPTMPLTAFKESKPSIMAEAAKATTTDNPTTAADWPKAKKRPTLTGRWPDCISLRVTLSIAAMWSASTACRRPNV